MPDTILPDQRPGFQFRPGTGRHSTPSRPRFRRGPELHAFGRAVRELRARRDLSQEALSAEGGLHRNYVGAIERGEINPTFHVLLKLTRGLRIPLPELIETYEWHLATLDRSRPRTADAG